MTMGRRRALCLFKHGLTIAAVAGAGAGWTVSAQTRAAAEQGAKAGVQPPRFSELADGTRFPLADRGPEPSGSPREAVVRGLTEGWRHRALRGITPNRFSIVEDEGNRVLRVEVLESASALVSRLNGPVEASMLRWRWRADGFPERASLGERARDDFAARVYLMFELPDSRLSLTDRLALAGAALIQGESVPAVSLVYLLHAGTADDRVVMSPFSDRVAMWAARAHAQAGQWYAEERDWKVDFERAFGSRYPGPVPSPVAIAVGADGDQTRASFSARFGDLRFA